MQAVLEGDAATVAENLMKEARTEMVETQRNEQGGVIRSSVEAKSQVTSFHKNGIVCLLLIQPQLL